MELIPLLVAGYGRSGTTALMSLLGTDSRVAMGRVYPFEDRHLTYLSKLATLLARNVVQPQPNAEQLYSFEDCAWGSFPWLPPGSTRNPKDHELPSATEWFQSLWKVAEGRIRSQHHSSAYYAEKVPAWIPAFVRRCLLARTLYLFRDPRDMYLSAKAFMQRRNYFSFGRGPQDSDLEHARNLAYEFLLYFENFKADKDRADCMLVNYADLIHSLAGLKDRLRQFADLQCSESAAVKAVESHRTSASPEISVDRWRREPLPPGVLSFLETYLQESMRTLGFELSTHSKIRPCPGVEFATASPLKAAGGKHISINLPIDPFPSSQAAEVWVSVYGPTLEKVSLFWRTGKQESYLSQPTYEAFHWRLVRFPVARQEHWRGRISELRLEMSCKSDQHEESPIYLRWVRLVE
jgi:hypothetical protein